MDPRRLVAASCVVVLISSTACTSGKAKAPSATPALGVLRLTNPVVEQRADPSVYKHTDGYYYLTASVPTYDQIEVRRATTLQGLGTATPVVVWNAKASGPQSGWVWAPEIFFIDGVWYVYYSASDAADLFPTHRMYSLRNSSADPTTGEWSENGQLKTDWESFSLDETSFVAGDQRYLVWAQQDPAIRNNSNLYIATMNSPTSISGKQVRIATPTMPWESAGFTLNEAPQVLQRNGRIFISYSASATDARYKLGLLTATSTADLLDPASWQKSPDPVFETSADNKVYGPGSNSFTVSEDGGDDILVYNARSYPEPTPDPLNDPNRSTRMQQLFYNEDGTPNFGVPSASGPTPTRLATVAGGRCLRGETPVTLAACDDDASEQVDFRHLGEGDYTIGLAGSCLEPGAGAQASTVVLTPCGDAKVTAEHRWRLRPAGTATFLLVNAADSGRCLVPGATTTGQPVLEKCATAREQQWTHG